MDCIVHKFSLADMSKTHTKVQAIQLLCHHHFDKFVVIHLTVTVVVCLTDHLIDFLVCQLLAKICHDMSQLRHHKFKTKRLCVLCNLGGRDETVAVFIKHLEGFPQLFFVVTILSRYWRHFKDRHDLHLLCHEAEELGKIDDSVSVRVDFVYHFLKLCFRWVLPQRAHHRSELLRRNRPLRTYIHRGHVFNNTYRLRPYQTKQRPL